MITLTSKGQLTLPAAVRGQLNLRPGDKLDCFVLDDGTIQMIPRQRTVRDLRGIVPRPPHALSLDEIEQCIRQGPMP